MDWFPWLLIGHFLGDFVFQNNWMALNKKDNLWPCIVHCYLYSMLVCLMLYIGGYKIGPGIFSLIYLSHHILDGTYLVDKWMKFYGIRSWDSSLPRAEDIYGRKSYIIWTEHPITKDVVTTSFGALIYVTIDNTLHLLMMMLIIKFY